MLQVRAEYVRNQWIFFHPVLKWCIGIVANCISFLPRISLKLRRILSPPWNRIWNHRASGIGVCRFAVFTKLSTKTQNMNILRFDATHICSPNFIISCYMSAIFGVDQQCDRIFGMARNEMTKSFYGWTERSFVWILSLVVVDFCTHLSHPFSLTPQN